MLSVLTVYQHISLALPQNMTVVNIVGVKCNQNARTSEGSNIVHGETVKSGAELKIANKIKKNQ